MSHIERAMYFDKDGKFKNDVDSYTIFPYITQARMNMRFYTQIQDTVAITAEKLVEPFTETFIHTTNVREAFLDGGALALMMARKSAFDMPDPNSLPEILRVFPLQPGVTLYGTVNQSVLDHAHETYESSRIRMPEIVPILEQLDPLYNSVRSVPDPEVTTQVMKYGFSGTLSRLADVADFMLNASRMQSDAFDQAYLRLVDEQGSF